jgi:hypothetical protein
VDRNEGVGTGMGVWAWGQEWAGMRVHTHTHTHTHHPHSSTLSYVGFDTHTLDSLFTLLQTKMAAQDETKSALAREYLAKIEKELKHTCKEVLVSSSPSC